MSSHVVWILQKKELRIWKLLVLSQSMPMVLSKSRDYKMRGSSLREISLFAKLETHGDVVSGMETGVTSLTNGQMSLKKNWDGQMKMMVSSGLILRTSRGSL
jgi:hypothetical protein